MNRSSQRLNATGHLNRVLEGEGIALADTLARLSDQEFENTLAALRLYRADVQAEGPAKAPVRSV